MNPDIIRKQIAEIESKIEEHANQSINYRLLSETLKIALKSVERDNP